MVVPALMEKWQKSTPGLRVWWLPALVLVADEAVRHGAWPSTCCAWCFSGGALDSFLPRGGRSALQNNNGLQPIPPACFAEEVPPEHIAASKIGHPDLPSDPPV